MLSEILKGTSEKELALRLFVYEDTVKQRLRDIFQKIGVRTRAEAAAWLERMAGADRSQGSSSK
jgi:DNA-binding NarL/FixJ family response regulator